MNIDFSATGGNFPAASLGAIGNVTYSGAFTPYGTTYRLGGGGGSLTFPAILPSGGALQVYGPGQVVLTGSNSYSGGTTVVSGILNAQNNSALGNGAVSVASGATLQLQNNISIGNTLSLSGTGAVRDRALEECQRHQFLLPADQPHRVHHDRLRRRLPAGPHQRHSDQRGQQPHPGRRRQRQHFQRHRQRGRHPDEVRLGHLDPLGANTYTGGTTVSAGVLNIQNATALGTTPGTGASVTSGAALQIQGNIAVGAKTLTLNGNGAAAARPAHWKMSAATIPTAAR